LVVWKSSNYTIDKDVIDAGKQLKLIARFGVGMEIIDVPYAQSKDIIVTNTPTSNSNAVAEHTMHLILACARNHRIVDKRFRSGEFNAIWRVNGIELEGRILGLIGIGQIGRLVASKAKYGFGMKVIGYNPHVGAGFPDEIEKVDTFQSLLAQSDFISLHVPATPETIGMFGTEEFKMMKPEAFFINTSRGEVVKEDEMVESLKNGIIKGAGLDVYTKEPLDPNSPLFDLDNVIMTPHYAAFSTDSLVRTGVQVAESIIAVSRGEKPKLSLPPR
jgi:D-3-phosphoglycerate dehydrogenase